MNESHKGVNPLLFSATSGASFFDNINSPAMLVPPAEEQSASTIPSELTSEDIGEVDSFLGQSTVTSSQLINPLLRTPVQSVAIIGSTASPLLFSPKPTNTQFTVTSPVPSAMFVPPVKLPTIGTSPSALQTPLGSMDENFSRPLMEGKNPRKPMNKYVVPPGTSPISAPFGASPSQFRSPHPAPIPPSFPAPFSLSSSASTPNFMMPLPSEKSSANDMTISPHMVTSLSTSMQNISMIDQNVGRIPASFEQMAVNPPVMEGAYHPVIPHWFYTSDQSGDTWKPFSFVDSLNLEAAFRNGTVEPLATEGGRYDVYVMQRRRCSVYWAEADGQVRRCSWFHKGQLESRPVPYDESVAEILESEFCDAMMTGRWQRHVDLNNADCIIMHTSRAIVHHPVVASDNFPTSPVGEMSVPLIVKRGTDDFEIHDGECETVDHLLFLVHGIGSVCDFRFRQVEECVDDFRHMGNQLIASHFKGSVNGGQVGRVEILPISWHKALHSDATGIDEKLKPITLRSIPKLREFTNDTLLDILFYTSPKYCQLIMDTVGSEINRLHCLFTARHPTFTGSVSLGGHSLGSVILFDLLMHQPPRSDFEEVVKKECMEALQKEEGVESIAHQHQDSITSCVDFVVGMAGTGQPSIAYPKLNFHPKAFFLMGSPVAMFVTIRGIDVIGPNFQLPTCDHVFNIFHPFDPVAYRLETLIDPTLIQLRPVLVPHHKGRKRLHLELKETIERVGTDIKQKIVDSIQSTWSRLSQLYNGASQPPSLAGVVDKAFADHLSTEQTEPDEAQTGSVTPVTVGSLNGGHRIDYVLQEKPYESFNEYIFALQAHCTYWESEDTLLMILKELYSHSGILSDADLPPSMAADVGGEIGYTSALSQTPESNLSYPTSYSEAAVTPQTKPVPLFTATVKAGQDPSVFTSAFVPPKLGGLGNVSARPIVIGGRPNVDPTSMLGVVPMGMDPTATPSSSSSVVGPPPMVLPTGTSFVRQK